MPQQDLSFKVSNYMVSLHNELGYGQAGRTITEVAQITLTGKADLKVVVTFIEDDTIPSPFNFYDPQLKTAFLYRRHNEYPWYIDLLRNENPVTANVSFVDNEPPYITLSTNRNK
jgi:hypothetical protein